MPRKKGKPIKVERRVAVNVFGPIGAQALEDEGRIKLTKNVKIKKFGFSVPTDKSSFVFECPKRAHVPKYDAPERYVNITIQRMDPPTPSPAVGIVPVEGRKAIPLVTGVLDYFPDALMAVAEVSVEGNVQHNGPGAPLHWDKTKSTDHADSAMRHMVDRGKLDVDGKRHSAKAAWRALAVCQIEIEQEREKEGK